MAPESSSTQIMNPLHVDPPLASSPAVHCIENEEQPEPKLKKIRLSGSFTSSSTDKIANNPNTHPIASATTSKSSSTTSTVSTKDTATDSAITTETTTNAGSGQASIQRLDQTSKTTESNGTSISTASTTPATSGSSSAMATVSGSEEDNTSSPPVATTIKTAQSEASTAAATSSALSKEDVPLKPKLFIHLKKKYHNELSYMLREFEKLERQLLGARKTEESAGSRERREKLHSFILHLQDTIQQIDAGVEQEASSSSTATSQPSSQPQHPSSSSTTAGSTSTDDGSSSPKQEDIVPKLEEHILTNLLPVKVRLKKQLDAQQGARHNPAGMPHSSGWTHRPPDSSVANSSTASTTGEPPCTFAAAAAEKRRRQAEQQQAATAAAYIEPQAPAPPVEPHQTQFGKPIEKGGSSLTKKLHGPTLGKKNATSQGAANDPDEDASSSQPEPPKRYYGGMALGSQQMQSSVTAASSVHKLMVRDTELVIKATNKNLGLPTASQNKNSAMDQEKAATTTAPSVVAQLPSKTEHEKPHEDQNTIVQKFQVEPYADMEDLERRRRRRRRRRKRQQRHEKNLILLHSAAAANGGADALQTASGAAAAAVATTKLLLHHRVEKKSRQVKKQRGPRQVEYMCALCNEVYSSTCECNPWWALTQQECPKCHKTQIPRVDISAPANAIEYHPALLAHADDNGAAAAAAAAAATQAAVVTTGGTGTSAEMEVVTSTTAPTPPVSVPPLETPAVAGSHDTVSLGSDVSSGLEDITTDDDESLDLESECEDSYAMTPSDRAENENFGSQYSGPKLDDKDASRLLVLMAHASICASQHKCEKQQEVCRSVRWMMLHVRDCPGTTSTFDVCPFPWCRKVKHLLYHLVTCVKGEQCQICGTPELSPNLQRLRGLNDHLLQKYRQLLQKKQQEQQTAAAAAVAATVAIQNAARARHPGEFVGGNHKKDAASIKGDTKQSLPTSISDEQTSGTAGGLVYTPSGSVGTVAEGKSTASNQDTTTKDSEELEAEHLQSLLESTKDIEDLESPLDDPLVDSSALEDVAVAAVGSPMAVEPVVIKQEPTVAPSS